MSLGDPAVTPRAATSSTNSARDDLARLLGRLTDGFIRAIPPGGSPARASLPGAPSGDLVPSIEGFARMSIAWAAWLREPSNGATVEWRGHAHDVGSILARGLVDATDPAGRWWWGPIGHRDQRIVEASEIATAVWLGGSRLRAAVDALDPKAFDRVLDWLALVDGRDVWPDNWVLFPMISALVRRAAGRPVHVDGIDAALDWMVAHHVGDGWSSDGAGHALDLYSGWAINWHLLWWVAIDGNRRPALRATIVRRARAWLRFVGALVASDGAFPRFGRSLGYRFAIAAPFAQAALLGIDPLPSGAARRLTGVLVQRALDEDAIDPATDWFWVGVGGERPEVVERYVSAGAAAWAAHAFIGLALPASHAFWSASAEPRPTERRDVSGTFAARGAGLLGVWRGRETTLHNARSGHPSDIPGHDYAATYGKLAYRSAFPFDVPLDSASAGSDDSVVAIEPGEDPRRRLAHRNESIRGGVGPSWIWTEYRLPTRSPATLRTIVLLIDDVEIRVTRVVPGSSIRLRAGGAALGTNDEQAIACRQNASDRTIQVSAGDKVVAIRALAGYDRLGTSESGPERTNLVHDRSVHPWIEEGRLSSARRLVASATIATRSPIDALALLRSVSLTPVNTDGAEVVVAVQPTPVLARVALGSHRSTTLEVGGWTVAGPSLRVVIASTDGSAIAGERIESVAGVFRLAHPGVVAVRRDHAAVDATVSRGIALDRRWAGTGLRSLRVRDGAAGFGDPIELVDPGVAPDLLVRRLARRAGTRLVTIRFERR